MLEQIERFKRMHKLIAARRTGKPAEFAHKIGVTERQLYNLLEEMKMLFPIEYNRYSNTYYYSDNVEVTIKFVVGNDESEKINGGGCFFQLTIKKRRVFAIGA
jgi:hypothetical protein